jgi:hypothetical protein
MACVSNRNVKRFRRGLVLKAHRLVYHPTLGSRVMKKRKRHEFRMDREREPGKLSIQEQTTPQKCEAVPRRARM